MTRKRKKILALLAVLCMLFTMHEGQIESYATEVSGAAAETAAPETAAPETVVEEDSALANGFIIDNAGTLAGYEGAGGDVIVPSEVTAVSAGVFAGNSSLTSVTLPASVVMLGTGVFANCTNLTTVTIQGNISSIPAQTFYNCSNLRSVYVPASVTSIGSDAFAECVSLSGITIPSGVSSIGERAFFDCSSLSGVSIPDAVSSIGANAFTGCSNMTSYSVASGNGHYASSGGCLYNKTMTRFLRCPEGRSSVSIEAGTKTIASNAFYQCAAIRSLTIPSSVKTIESNAFTDSGISDVTMMASVTNIGSQSGWTADIIYGETNSAAETYANNNSIVFQALNATPPTETETETETQTETETEKKPGTENSGDGNNGGSQNNGSGNNSGSVGGNSGSTVGNGGGTSGATKTTSGTAYTSGSAKTTSTNGKDATPKTGDGINPIFFFCIAFLLAGGCLFIVGKKKAAQYDR